ncbi:MAG: DUF2933 domain-containing protein, partial [Dehalococcoidia bacterium]
MRMCLNWKVVAGLVAVGVGIWLLLPGLAAALPLLILAVCPLSMLVMMWSMGRMGNSECATPAAGSPSAAIGPSRAEQLAELRAQLNTVQAQRESITHQIARLEEDVPGEHPPLGGGWGTTREHQRAGHRGGAPSGGGWGT